MADQLDYDYMRKDYKKEAREVYWGNRTSQLEEAIEAADRKLLNMVGEVLNERVWDSTKKCYRGTGKATMVDTIEVKKTFVADEFKKHSLRLAEESKDASAKRGDAFTKTWKKDKDPPVIKIYTLGGRQ